MTRAPAAGTARVIVSRTAKAPSTPPVSFMEDLVAGARQGDRASWDAMVERFGDLIWSVARGFGMSRSDAAEVSQTTWLRLAENLDNLEHPDRLAAWLVTTTRRECLRQRRLGERRVPFEELELDAKPVAGPAADTVLVIAERDTAVWHCIKGLPERSYALLMMLLADPPASYAEIAATLDMPIGSIGPTRARLMATLRRRFEAAGITAID